MKRSLPKEVVGIFRRRWHGILSDPSGLIRLAIAFVRGTRYALQYRLFRKNVHIRLPFFVYTQRVQIQGPGRVEIGPYCSAYPNAFDGLSIATLAPAAYVAIGQKATMGGLTIRCRNRVIIGDRIMTANSLIQDDYFVHSDYAQARTLPPSHTTDHIVIGNNVWLGHGACILPGTTIGDDAVISEGAVCLNRSVRGHHLAIGNPVVRCISIEQLLRFRDKA